MTAVARLLTGETETRAQFDAEPGQKLDTVARAVIRCFDEVSREYGESGYRGKWGEHFPRFELEALRSLWRRAGA
ncbi:hypothetical protein DN069_33330 [Streptacidiphilus pinicola]|uniref:Uncharacterized protein n=1 Tax=Streptacidiphilus pinicola TaxID=2219663 RepID=A0A2X0IA15_9ACTN|nr:hypothetical protein DN069_33330 [Streptacidiphilus pinicola]